MGLLKILGKKLGIMTRNQRLVYLIELGEKNLSLNPLLTNYYIKEIDHDYGGDDLNQKLSLRLGRLRVDCSKYLSNKQ